MQSCGPPGIEFETNAVKLNSWRATALQSLAPTLIKHLIQLIKSFRLNWKLHGLCVGAGLHLNSAGLRPSRNWVWHPCSNVNQCSNSTLMWFNKKLGKMKKSTYPWLQQQPAPCCIFPAIEYSVPRHSQDPNKENTFIHCRPQIIFLCILFNGLQYFCFQRSIFKADPILNRNTSLQHENDLLVLLLFETCLTFFCGTKKRRCLAC